MAKLSEIGGRKLPFPALVGMADGAWRTPPAKALASR
jgi:hypothetical protein